MPFTLFGFGGTMLKCGTEIARFPDSTGHINFVRKLQKWTSRDNVDRSRFIGYQPIITVFLHNLDTDMAIEFANLVSVLNESDANDTPISVYPRYDFENEAGIMIPCKLISDFDPQDLANCEVGQTIELTFQSTQKFTEIPNFFSGWQIYNVIDYENNNIVDYEDNQIIIVN
jgi:hypothetical protein